MKILRAVMVFFVVSSVVCFQNHLKHNTWQPHNSHLSTWAGSSCDEKCKQAGGFVCGIYFKDCCKQLTNCAGNVWKECEEGNNIPLQCQTDSSVFSNIKKFIGQNISSTTVSNTTIATNKTQSAVKTSQTKDNKTVTAQVKSEVATKTVMLTDKNLTNQTATPVSNPQTPSANPQTKPAEGVKAPSESDSKTPVRPDQSKSPNVNPQQQNSSQQTIQIKPVIESPNVPNQPSGKPSSNIDMGADSSPQPVINTTSTDITKVEVKQANIESPTQNKTLQSKTATTTTKTETPTETNKIETIVKKEVVKASTILDGTTPPTVSSQPPKVDTPKVEPPKEQPAKASQVVKESTTVKKQQLSTSGATADSSAPNDTASATTTITKKTSSSSVDPSTSTITNTKTRSINTINQPDILDHGHTTKTQQ